MKQITVLRLSKNMNRLKLIVGILVPYFLRADVLNFDQMFPLTPYAQLLAGCTRISGDLDAIHPQELTIEELMYFNDHLVGRLCAVHKAFETMLANTSRLLRDDAQYLEWVINEIARKYSQRFSNDQPHLSRSFACIHYLQQRIDALLTQGQ